MQFITSYLVTMELVVLGLTIFYVLLSPYNKVEESFNTQATHDILYHGMNLEYYDHFQYPGVVPRSFLGPIFLSFVASPYVSLVQILGASKLYSQYLVRIILGLTVFWAWTKLRKSFSTHFGSSVTLWFSLITCTQFHFLYYMSRLLPNSFALIFALLAISYWMEQKHKKMVWASGICVIVFRAELCLLLGPMLLYELHTKRISFLSLLKELVIAGAVILSVTVLVDSVFWGRWVWPEGEVFWFNTYQNQSSNWGVYPFLWYWYSALPRALGLSYGFAIFGITIDPRIRTVVAPALLFVALYSFLPHKELRFILYALPLFNIAAARACQYTWMNRAKSRKNQVFALVACGHILANAVLTILLASVSSMNYPGGEAMQLLHEKVDGDAFVDVHIGNLAAQTGASRYTEQNPFWRYDKTEHLKPGGPEMDRFSHLLVEAKSKYAYNLKHYTDTHEIMGHVESFSHFSLNYNAFPPIKIRLKPAIYLLRRLSSAQQTHEQTEIPIEFDVLPEQLSNQS